MHGLALCDKLNTYSNSDRTDVELKLKAITKFRFDSFRIFSLSIVL